MNPRILHRCAIQQMKTLTPMNPQLQIRQTSVLFCYIYRIKQDQEPFVEKDEVSIPGAIFHNLGVDHSQTDEHKIQSFLPVRTIPKTRNLPVISLVFQEIKSVSKTTQSK